MLLLYPVQPASERRNFRFSLSLLTSCSSSSSNPQPPHKQPLSNYFFVTLEQRRQLNSLCCLITGRESWSQTLFSSNTLKTKEANLVGSPKGKNCLYIFWKPTASSCPLGQSLMKPLYLQSKAHIEVISQSFSFKWKHVISTRVDDSDDGLKSPDVYSGRCCFSLTAGAGSKR